MCPHCMASVMVTESVRRWRCPNCGRVTVQLSLLEEDDEE